MHSRSSTRLMFSAAGLLVACPAPEHAETDGPGTTTPTLTSSTDTDSPTSSTTHAPPVELTTGTTATITSDASTSGAALTTTSDVSSTTFDAASSSGVTGEPDTPVCGDAVLDPGEGCDDGYAANADDANCTLSCQPAECGDGLLWQGYELCDLGTDNNDNLYGGCTTQCMPGPACGDSVVQGPEECDDGVFNGTGESEKDGVPCDSGCRFAAKLVYVSSALYTGGEIGGVEGAHIQCQILSESAGFDNAVNFKAFISDADWSPAVGFTHTTLPLVLPNGVRVADDWDDLLLNGPGNGIVVTETGEVVLEKNVWTGTAPSGMVFDPDQTCMGWSSASPLLKARWGRNGVDPAMTEAWMQWAAEKQWVSSESVGCWLQARLYCVEQ